MAALKTSTCADPPREEWVDKNYLLPTDVESEMSLQRRSEVMGHPGVLLMQREEALGHDKKKPKLLALSSPALNGDLPEELTCPLCRDAFSDPLLLDCGHNFCRSCLSTAWTHQPSPSCPRCFRLFPGQRCTPNRALGSLARHVQEAQGGNDAGQPLEEESCRGEGGRPCWDYSSPKAKPARLRYQDDAEKYREGLASAVVQLQSRLQHLRALCAERERSIAKHTEAVCGLERHLRAQFSSLQRFLRGREEQLQRELQEEAAWPLQEGQQELHDMRAECQRIEEAVASARAKMAQSDTEAFLTGLKLVTDRCSEMQSKDPPALSCTVLERHILGRFRGPVQYAAWRDMRAVLEPALSCPLLDPDSAHPGLVLSEGQRRVSYSPVSRPPSPGPERFSQYLVALGIPRYRSGKHYWEMELGSSTQCDIGVTLETISRRDPFTLTPGDGCWVCSVRDGCHFVAFESPPVVFAQPEELRRIGVYLDYEAGQVSFYNAPSMSHLYTFLTPFQGNLRAYVSPCCVTPGEQGLQLLRVFQGQG